MAASFSGDADVFAAFAGAAMVNKPASAVDSTAILPVEQIVE